MPGARLLRAVCQSRWSARPGLRAPAGPLDPGLFFCVPLASGEMEGPGIEITRGLRGLLGPRPLGLAWSRQGGGAPGESSLPQVEQQLRVVFRARLPTVTQGAFTSVPVTLSPPRVIWELCGVVTFLQVTKLSECRCPLPTTEVDRLGFWSGLGWPGPASHQGLPSHLSTAQGL